MFRCNLPPALLTEWLGSFTCHCDAVIVMCMHLGKFTTAQNKTSNCHCIWCVCCKCLSECVGAFGLIYRNKDQSNEKLLSFMLDSAETRKEELLTSLCKTIANALCRTDFVSCIVPSSANKACQFCSFSLYILSFHFSFFVLMCVCVCVLYEHNFFHTSEKLCKWFFLWHYSLVLWRHNIVTTKRKGKKDLFIVASNGGHSYLCIEWFAFCM